jgi:hypothetical protein
LEEVFDLNVSGGEDYNDDDDDAPAAQPALADATPVAPVDIVNDTDVPRG